MNRRFLITLGNDEEPSVAQLSCEQLYMHFQGIRTDAYSAKTEAGTAEDAPWWSGEPPLQLDTGSADDFFQEIESQLAVSKVLKISGREWLSKRDFGEPLEQLIQRFEESSGEVIFIE